MDLDSAIRAHAEWKGRFRAAMSARQQLPADVITRDDRCPLGGWLHGEAKARYSGLKTYGACLAAHAGFHQHAGAIAASINQGRYEQAEAAMAGGTPYSAASSAVGVAVLALRKEAGV